MTIDKFGRALDHKTDKIDDTILKLTSPKQYFYTTILTITSDTLDDGFYAFVKNRKAYLFPLQSAKVVDIYKNRSCKIRVNGVDLNSSIIGTTLKKNDKIEFIPLY